jgi:hypothetical protein
MAQIRQTAEHNMVTCGAVAPALFIHPKWDLERESAECSTLAPFLSRLGSSCTPCLALPAVDRLQGSLGCLRGGKLNKGVVLAVALQYTQRSTGQYTGHYMQDTLSSMTLCRHHQSCLIEDSKHARVHRPSDALRWSAFDTTKLALLWCIL